MSEISTTIFERLKALENRNRAGIVQPKKPTPEIFKPAVEMRPETVEITVSREETRQILRYEPVRLATSVTFQVSGNIDAAIMAKHDELRELFKHQFERESVLRLEEKKKPMKEAG